MRGGVRRQNCRQHHARVCSADHPCQAAEDGLELLPQWSNIWASYSTIDVLVRASYNLWVISLSVFLDHGDAAAVRPAAHAAGVPYTDVSCSIDARARSPR